MYDRGWVSKKIYRYTTELTLESFSSVGRGKRSQWYDNISRLQVWRMKLKVCSPITINYVMPTANLCNKLLQGYTTMIICDRLASTLCRGRLRRGTSGQLTVTSRRIRDYVYGWDGDQGPGSPSVRQVKLCTFYREIIITLLVGPSLHSWLIHTDGWQRR